jgi:hypothetical protein
MPSAPPPHPRSWLLLANDVHSRLASIFRSDHARVIALVNANVSVDRKFALLDHVRVIEIFDMKVNDLSIVRLLLLPSLHYRKTQVARGVSHDAPLPSFGLRLTSLCQPSLQAMIHSQPFD